MSNTLETILREQEYINLFLDRQALAICTTLSEKRGVQIKESTLPSVKVSADEKYLPLTIQGGVAIDLEENVTIIHAQTLAQITDRYPGRDNLGLLPTITLAARLVALKARGEALAIDFTDEEQWEIHENTALLVMLMMASKQE